MSHTPEQARQLWCPMVRMNNPHAEHCVSEKCAMWRWDGAGPSRQRVTCVKEFAEFEPERPSYLEEYMTFVPYDDDDDEGFIAHWIEDEQHWISRRRGYCGLAGKPAEEA